MRKIVIISLFSKTELTKFKLFSNWIVSVVSPSFGMQLWQYLALEIDGAMCKEHLPQKEMVVELAAPPPFWRVNLDKADEVRPSLTRRSNTSVSKQHLCAMEQLLKSIRAVQLSLQRWRNEIAAWRKMLII